MDMYEQLSLFRDSCESSARVISYKETNPKKVVSRKEIIKKVLHLGRTKKTLLPSSVN